jgi:hypothetical protein
MYTPNLTGYLYHQNHKKSVLRHMATNIGTETRLIYDLNSGLIPPHALVSQ